jgi:hypothetical protein
MDFLWPFYLMYILATIVLAGVIVSDPARWAIKRFLRGKQFITSYAREIWD